VLLTRINCRLEKLYLHKTTIS